MSYKVVHLSQTPLVGSPGKISKALNKVGVLSSSYYFVDYPKKGGLHGKFVDNGVVISEAGDVCHDFILDDLISADIIHIHNNIDGDYLDKVAGLCSKSHFVYQVHSPLREGPLFLERAESLGVPFAKKLVVGQYQPRLYQNYTPVPNIISDSPSFRARKNNAVLSVMFSPSHSRAGRWNAKHSEGLEQTLRTLSANGKIDLLMPDKPLTPKELMLMRRQMDLSIDEIVTGAYHQISLESLCAGNVTVNRADFFSKSMLSGMTGCMGMPPFVYADETSILDTLIRFADDVDLTNKVKKESYDFFCQNLIPESLIQPYLEVYERVI